MPEKHFNIIEYYQSGDRSMKKKAKDWLKLLNDAYDKNFNRIGVDKMYQVLKEAKNNVEGKYPTKRFIRDFLQRQEHYQLNKKSSEKQIQFVLSLSHNQIQFYKLIIYISSGPLMV